MKTSNIYLKNQCQLNMDIDTVRQHLKTYLKMRDDQIDKVLANPETLIKKNATADEIVKFEKVLTRCGTNMAVLFIYSQEKSTSKNSFTRHWVCLKNRREGELYSHLREIVNWRLKLSGFVAVFVSHTPLRFPFQGYFFRDILY